MILHFIIRRNVKMDDKNKILPFNHLLHKNDVALQNILGMFRKSICVCGVSYKMRNCRNAVLNNIASINLCIESINAVIKLL